MTHIEETGPILYIDLLRGMRASGRRPYTPPRCTEIGTLDDLIYLRDTISRHIVHLYRLAINGERLLPYLPEDQDWYGDIVQDLAHLCVMLRLLLARRPRGSVVKVPPLV